ncbi:MAG: FAD-dependent oxidoreductase [Xanthomonadales bacterium]|nr:FAD-dependent oxidoreductase [Xanthomonadales bacterium]
MKILVLGAGVIGVTTAHALSRLGHEVLVIDQADGVASQASHANGAQLAYSYVDPFANFATLKKIPKYMLGFDEGIRLRFTNKFSYYAWGLEFIRHCTSKKAAANMQVMLELAHTSKQAMSKIYSEIPAVAIRVHGAGKIVLAGTPQELEKLNASVALKKSYGFDVEILDKDSCILQEPGLGSWQGEFCGGIYAPGDKVLDPLVFCQTIQAHSESKYGVGYYFGHTILKLKQKNNKITQVQTDKDIFNCDAAIVCLGEGANNIIKTIDKAYPVYPMRGYSLTLDTGKEVTKTSITDPISKIVFSNLGGKIRIAGFLDANIPETKIDERGRALLATAQKLWPSIANYDGEANFWTGLRPMTPSGIPIVKKSKINGLYYNIGHGSLGLTLAAGSAQRIAQLIEGVRKNTGSVIPEDKHEFAQ